MSMLFVGCRVFSFSIFVCRCRCRCDARLRGWTTALCAWDESISLGGGGGVWSITCTEVSRSKRLDEIASHREAEREREAGVVVRRGWLVNINNGTLPSER
ncbi:hypothetical protein V8C34DRAFT_230557 [Trichoderma compactum]